MLENIKGIYNKIGNMSFEQIFMLITWMVFLVGLFGRYVREDFLISDKEILMAFFGLVFCTVCAFTKKKEKNNN